MLQFPLLVGAFRQWSKRPGLLLLGQISVTDLKKTARSLKSEHIYKTLRRQQIIVPFKPCIIFLTFQVFIQRRVY